MLNMQIYYLRIMRLFILFVLILAGLSFGMVLIALIAIGNGASMADIMNQSTMLTQSAALTRFILFINHATMFLIPGLAWAFIYYKKNWLQGLQLKKRVPWIYFLAGIAFLMVSYPLVSKSMEINQSMDLPNWMSDMENQTEVILKNILTMPTILALMANLIVIAILPGIGEELIFRGIIQKELLTHIKSPYVAILLSSIIFSALHFQFEGFIPRFMLGMVLGLLFYWTGSLWVSMAVHAFNNGMQVLITYFYPELIDQDLESSVPVTWFALIGSFVLSVCMGYWFHSQKKVHPDSSEPIDSTTYPVS